MKKQKILITGGTGSLGQALTRKLLQMDVETIRILSRNESKQVEMEERFNDDRLRFLIGDIRDKERLEKSFEDIDVVIHTAALKHVPIIEYNPFEAIKTNVIGSQNVIDAAITQDVKKILCIGTDKSVSPLNTYGATKLLMEKLFITANNFINKSKHNTNFSAVRLGNFFGSSGSVIPKFIEQIKNNREITVTHNEMTRFSVTMEQTLDFILDCAQNGKPSEVYIPKMKAYTVSSIVKAFQNLFPNVKVQTIGPRSGEKFHEVLISEDESRYAWDIGNKYMISNPDSTNDSEIKKSYDGKIKNVEDKTEYSSENVEKISVDEIQKQIQQFRQEMDIEHS
jgi:UDP-N-acetylglucosamine 4,6-dehydratase/UDP-glucose 4-epimerase